MTADEVLIRLGNLGVVVFANGDGLELVRPGGQGGVPARLVQEAQLSHKEIKALLNRAAKGFYKPHGREALRVDITPDNIGTVVLDYHHFANS